MKYILFLLLAFCNISFANGVSLYNNITSVTEGTYCSLSTLTARSSVYYKKPLYIQIKSSNSNVVEGVDYTYERAASSTYTPFRRETRNGFTIKILNGADVEIGESFRVHIYSDAGLTNEVLVTGDISIIDAFPVVSSYGGTTSVMEGFDAWSSVKFNRDTVGDGLIYFRVEPISPTLDSNDFESTSGSFALTSYSRRRLTRDGVASVRVKSDRDVEGDETFRFGYYSDAALKYKITESPIITLTDNVALHSHPDYDLYTDSVTRIPVEGTSYNRSPVTAFNGTSYYPGDLHIPGLFPNDPNTQSSYRANDTRVTTLATLVNARFNGSAETMKNWFYPNRFYPMMANLYPYEYFSHIPPNPAPKIPFEVVPTFQKGDFSWGMRTGHFIYNYRRKQLELWFVNYSSQQHIVTPTRYGIVWPFPTDEGLKGNLVLPAGLAEGKIYTRHIKIGATFDEEGSEGTVRIQ